MSRRDNEKTFDDKSGDDGADYVEVGQGQYCVVTVDRRDGSTVVQRFRTRDQARAQHRRNVAADKPMAGLDGVN